jgi:hypothetical protein
MKTPNFANCFENVPSPSHPFPSPLSPGERGEGEGSGGEGSPQPFSWFLGARQPTGMRDCFVERVRYTSHQTGPLPSMPQGVPGPTVADHPPMSHQWLALRQGQSGAPIRSKIRCPLQERRCPGTPRLGDPKELRVVKKGESKHMLTAAQTWTHLTAETYLDLAPAS